MSGFWPFRREAKITLREAAAIYIEKLATLSPRGKRNMHQRLKVWERFQMPSRASRIRTEDFERFRTEALKEGLRPVTIESTISQVLTLLRFVGPPRIGRAGLSLIAEAPALGRKLPTSLVPRPAPTIEDISAVYRVADAAQYPRGKLPPPAYIRGFLVTSYYTALRLGDLINFNASCINDRDERIEVQAQKTGKLHWIPITPAFRVHLDDLLKLHGAADGEDCELLFVKSLDPHLLRQQIKHLCDLAEVPHFGPQGIRRRTATEYEMVQSGAGGLILGHNLRSTTFQSYISAFQILKRASLSLPEPAAFLRES